MRRWPVWAQVTVGILLAAGLLGCVLPFVWGFVLGLLGMTP